MRRFFEEFDFVAFIAYLLAFVAMLGIAFWLVKAVE